MEMKQSMQTKLTEVDQLKSEVDRLTNLVRHEERAAKHIEERNYDLKDYIEEEEGSKCSPNVQITELHGSILRAWNVNIFLQIELGWLFKK